MRFAQPLFEGSGFRGLRRVIDVSGDGVNNQGIPVTLTRDEVLERGITINGLPILLKRPSAATMDIENLDIYYEDCVIGGPGAFIIPINARDQFREAIRTKLVLEIAGRQLPARVIPAAASAPRISCLIGERMWQERWGGSGTGLQIAYADDAQAGLLLDQSDEFISIPVAVRSRVYRLSLLLKEPLGLGGGGISYLSLV